MNYMKNIIMKIKEKSKKILVTHDGSFHSDDIFAAAVLSIMLEAAGETFEIIRTRDIDIIASADYVFDVGGVYDAEKNRFDHHQVGGAGKYDQYGIDYASFGLVWKKFGEEISGSPKAAQLIQKRLVISIDAWDNGVDLATNKFGDLSPYFLQHIFLSMEPTWQEEDANLYEIFLKCVALAKDILQREVVQAQAGVLAEEKVIVLYNAAPDKKIIILDKNYPCQYVLNIFPEPLFVIYPRKNTEYKAGESESLWGVKAIRQDPKSFKNRKDLPASWAGLRDEELQKVTGVSDAIFCHRGLFLAVAKSKEGAIKLAQIALLG